MTTTTRLDAAYLSIIAALGLQLACAKPTEEEAGDDETADSTGDGDGDGDGDPGDGDGDDAEEFVCNNPTPIMQAGTDVASGFVRCDGGFVHREQAVECVAPAGSDDPRCASAGPGEGCQSAADCMAAPYGSCQSSDPVGGCTCTYGCATDADCKAGQMCLCAGVLGPYPQCVPADCAISDECGGGLCGLSTLDFVCGDSFALACASPNEACHVDADCPQQPCPDHEESAQQWGCEGVPGQGWSCQRPSSCEGVCGRPLFVEGHARVAATIEREDWACACAIESLDAETRATLAQHWTQIGQFEHASVASFARFAMHLLRLGAPPQLLLETHAAMADEVAHARLAFGLASAYAKRPLGPGALDLRDSIELDIDPRAIVAALVHEACVGETLAAIEAGEAATLARDPVVAATLERIAADELRHAQLAWRALRWMLEVGGEPLQRFAFAELDAAVREVLAARVEDGVPASLREHGLLDDELRTRVRRQAAQQLLAPCVAALVRSHARGERPSARASA